MIVVLQLEIYLIKEWGNYHKKHTCRGGLRTGKNPVIL